MSHKDGGRAADAELEILNILWARGPSTVRDVHDALTAVRNIRYTTSLKTLQVMTAKGFVKRDASDRAHLNICGKHVNIRGCAATAVGGFPPPQGNNVWSSAVRAITHGLKRADSRAEDVLQCYDNEH